jgi:3-polyprenyl-4-hydroxybenzoate decarboxylase
LRLHTPDMDLYIPPKDKNTWMRFRNCTNAFYEVVTNPIVSMKSQAEIYVQNQEMKQYIEALEKEISDNKSYKEKFEALEKS